MSFRQMRVFVMFDLPTDTALDRREYRVFRKYLMDTGFIMMQESVYCRMVLNGSVQKSVYELIKRNKPSGGVVQLLTVTEKQFSGISYITGSFQSDVIDNDERVIIL